MSYSSRFWLYAPLCMFLGLAAFVGLHWWSVASALDRKLDAMKGHEAVPGIVVDWRAKTLSGFPFNIDLMLDGLSIKGAGAHGPFAWEAEKFALHALTYGREQQVMEAAGQQRLSWTDEDGAAHDVTFLPAELHASTVFASHGLARFDLDILDAGGRTADGGAFTAGRLQFHARRDPAGEGIDLAASADRLKGAAIAPEIGSARLTGLVKNSAAFAGLLKGETSWPAAQAEWKRQGGGVKLDSSGVTAEQAAKAGKLLSGLY